MLYVMLLFLFSLPAYAAARKSPKPTLSSSSALIDPLYAPIGAKATLITQKRLAEIIPHTHTPCIKDCLQSLHTTGIVTSCQTHKELFKEAVQSFTDIAEHDYTRDARIQLERLIQSQYHPQLRCASWTMYKMSMLTLFNEQLQSLIPNIVLHPTDLGAQFNEGHSCAHEDKEALWRALHKYVFVYLLMLSHQERVDGATLDTDYAERKSLRSISMCREDKEYESSTTPYSKSDNQKRKVACCTLL